MLPSHIFLDDFFDDYKDVSKHPHNMKCDIISNDEAYVILVDMPGIKKEDVTLDIEDNYLTISYKRKEKENVDVKYVHRERKPLLSETRKFYLSDVVEDKITASLTDGILKIIVPKKLESEKKEISID